MEQLINLSKHEIGIAPHDKEQNKTNDKTKRSHQHLKKMMIFCPIHSPADVNAGTPPTNVKLLELCNLTD